MTTNHTTAQQEAIESWMDDDPEITTGEILTILLADDPFAKFADMAILAVHQWEHGDLGRSRAESILMCGGKDFEFTAPEDRAFKVKCYVAQRLEQLFS